MLACTSQNCSGILLHRELKLVSLLERPNDPLIPEFDHFMLGFGHRVTTASIITLEGRNDQHLRGDWKGQEGRSVSA